jgi:hypothetical protein
VGDWYARLIAPQLELSSKLADVLRELIQNQHTSSAKIAAIHQFVLRNTRYVGLEFGVHGYKPYPVSQIYERRFGDCKDKSSLLLALLRAAGIPAEIALVRTRRLGDIDEQATSVSIFNHAIVYLPEQNLWLDGTAEYAGSRELPLEDQGAMALTVDSDRRSRLRRIPVSLPMQNLTDRQVRAQILPDGAVRFSGSLAVRGEDAPRLRREYEVTERQREAFRNHLTQVFPSVLVDSVQVDGTSDLEADVSLKFRGTLDGLAGTDSDSLPISWSRRSYVKTLASLSTRTQDLVLSAPWTTQEELHFALPAGAQLERLPRDQDIETPFGTGRWHYQLQNHELVIRSFVQFRQMRIHPAEYPLFRDFCGRLESTFQNGIKVMLH